MPKNTRKFSLSKQKRALLLLEWCTGFRPAGSVWVLLLALRGFSLVEIGAAEGLFHVVSLCCELPSGVLADVWGRKRTLTASYALFLASALLMAASGGYGGACLSLAVSAMGYNLQSGTREAITYESMLQASREADYLKFSSLQNGVYRFSDGGAMLLAGATVLLGWRTAYLLDAGIALIGLAAGLLDDALQLVSDKRLNDRFPSAQRATLVSVSSMAFSLCMIPLSPLFGWFFM